MKGKLVVIALALIIIYPLLIAVFYFASPFMVSWGSEPEWYIKIIAFLQNIPFNLQSKGGEIHMGFIFINALFWTLCLAVVFWVLSIKVFKEKNIIV